MSFDELFDQAIAILQRRGRVSYRALQRQLALDDDLLEILKEELIEVHALATDQDGKMLLWTGHAASMPFPPSPVSRPLPVNALSHRPEAEYRHLTVMFCDLVGSTSLAALLDLEDYREVIKAYQDVCAEVIDRFEGHIAQYLGDGVLVYFGYPQALENAAHRAIRAGLGILKAIEPLQARLARDKAISLAIRLGVHTGPVVVGEIGQGERREWLALGETPNVAAYLQSFAAPDSLVISEATARLVRGYFEYQDLGVHALKGTLVPTHLYRVLGETSAQSRLDAAGGSGLTPLVGRQTEMALLQECWQHSLEGRGQSVLIRGEAGIGKSRLVETLGKQIASDNATHMVFHCSPYYTNSALYPVIAQVRHCLQLSRAKSPEVQFEKLERGLQRYRFACLEALQLFAMMLSIPIPEGAAPLDMSPQCKKQKTLEFLVAWLLEECEQYPVLAVWEDFHWADPSTLDLFELILAQVPTARLMTLLTFRPDFHPPWAIRSHMTYMTLGRLEHVHVEAMITQIMSGKALPAEVVHHVVSKADGVPLFIEELVNMLLESELLRQHATHYELVGSLSSLVIPTTLQDLLMARLDRSDAMREVAQIGATIGREFSYELIEAVAPLDEEMLEHGLTALVEATLLYQQGIPPHANYAFKHTLIQDTAYRSLLKSTRQDYHQRIAESLVECFSDTVDTQPELLAYHCTQAGLLERAVGYWHLAGEKALRHSAYVEASNHLHKALEILATLPDTPERIQQELTLQMTLGPILSATKGQADPQVERVYARARALCQRVADPHQLFHTLWGLWRFHNVRANHRTAQELGAQLLSLAQQAQAPTLLLKAYMAVGASSFWLGKLTMARAHLEQGLTFYGPLQNAPIAFRSDAALGPIYLSYIALVLWELGYSDQAQQRSQEALVWAQQLAHPFCLAQTLLWQVQLHQCMQEAQTIPELTEAMLALSRERGFALYAAAALFRQGWALTIGGQIEEGIAQMRRGLADIQVTGAGLRQPTLLGYLAESYGRVGRGTEGLCMIDEALILMQQTAECWWEAELYRLKGELLLALPVDHQGEAETWLWRALNLAHHQQSKALELRATISLSRLWQRQGNADRAYQVLTTVYSWFTEGLTTRDLREARAFLEALS